MDKEKEQKGAKYEEWDSYFTMSNQQNFKDEVKQWLKKHKEHIKGYFRSIGRKCESTSPYGMLAEWMGLKSQSSINNWMSERAQKQIPDKQVNKIREFMAVIEQYKDSESLEAGATHSEMTGEEIVMLFKERLTFEAIGRFYTEAEQAGKSLDDYLRSMLK